MDTANPPVIPIVAQAGPDPTRRRERWLPLGICVALAVLVWSVFGQTLGFAFTNYDDGDYVYDNPYVTNGLSWHGVLWAFTHFHASNWHPLTWISHMADAQIYGPHAGGHHATNVLWHTVAVILLFVAWREMTGALWRSACVAAVFAIHPLRVESVAWVAERKDVLSGVFFMLTLWTYARYSRAAAPRRWYAAALGSFALGLLAKPSLVTLPFVLLLLDFWPLGRLTASAVRRLLVEKVPFFALAIVCCVVTVFAQTNATMSIGSLPLDRRIENASLGYVTYLWKMVWPTDLAVLYPLWQPAWWMVALALGLLAAVTVITWLARRRAPWLLVGWCWYLGVLVPMIGLMQVGSQSHADRYTYLSQIGLYVAAVWTLAAWAGEHRTRRLALSGAGAALVVTLAVGAFRQVTYWRDSESLWRRTLACTTGNSFAHNLLAVALSEQGRGDEAFAEFQKSLRINSRDAGTHFHMGLYLAKHGRLTEAIRHLRRSLQILPENPGAEANLGLALANQGRTTEAVLHYRKALEIEPDFVEAENDLAWTLATHPDSEKRDGAEAVKLARRSCEASNYKVSTYLDTYAAALAETGDYPGAVHWAQEALVNAGNDADLQKELQERLATYEQGKPWREADRNVAL